MTRTLPINVGHIISSPEFAFGARSFDHEDGTPNPTIIIDGNPNANHVVSMYRTQAELIEAALQGKRLSDTYDLDMSACDLTRGSAKFVVIRAVMEGGSHGGRNDYPDELHITARKLFPSGLFNPDGEVISFYYQASGRSNSVENVTIHDRQMKMIFV